MYSWLCGSDGMGRRKAIVAVLINVAVYVMFSLIYALYFKYSDDNWSKKSDNPWLDGFYVGGVVHMTLGYGDYYPKTWYGKILVASHIGFVFLFLLYVGTACLN
jgi:hypothetical protein